MAKRTTIDILKDHQAGQKATGFGQLLFIFIFIYIRYKCIITGYESLI